MFSEGAVLVKKIIQIQDTKILQNLPPPNPFEVLFLSSVEKDALNADC